MNNPIPHNLLQAYFEGTADDRQIAELSAWVEASPDHASYLNAMGWLDQALSQQLTHQAVDQMSDQERAFLDRVDPDAWELILDSALSAKAEAQPLQMTEASQPPAKPTPARIELREVRDVIGYLLAEGVRKRPGVFVALAAMLVLSTALFFVLPPGRSQSTQNITEQPPATTPSPRDNAGSTPARAAVATLTATHNTQWAKHPADPPAEGASAPGDPSPPPGRSASADPAPGDKLHAGTRLTLTAGFAEITTARGAVVILEAPATIELIDHDNALRLHAGKLVGICETESSKGFLVRTPHMDVTDLGTHFGIDLSVQGQTRVHVLEGSVQCQPVSDKSISRVLERHEAVRIDTAGEMTAIAYAPNQFVQARAFAALQDAEQSAWSQSLAQRYERVRSDGVVLDLAFDEDDAGQLIATSLAHHDRPLTVKAQGLVPGRFGERTAVRLAGQDQFVEATLDEPMLAMSVAGWFYIDSLDHEYAALLHSDYDASDNNQADLHWHIQLMPDDTVKIGMTQLRDRGLKAQTDVSSAPLPKAQVVGRWVHLAMTVDTVENRVVLYLDGEVVAALTRFDYLPIQLGTFHLGAWQQSQAVAPETQPNRQLRGAVDEFVLLDRLLTAEEVLALSKSHLP